jgi:hypothetical protein
MTLNPSIKEALKEAPAKKFGKKSERHLFVCDDDWRRG